MEICLTYEQWFSNDNITGKSDTLKAVSAIASITSWKEIREIYVLKLQVMNRVRNTST